MCYNGQKDVRYSRKCILIKMRFKELSAIVCRVVAVAALLMLALASDLKTYKIKNYITYGFMLAGIAANSAVDGLDGLVLSLRGILLPAACLLVLYMMRVIGAGDIKLFSALGSVMGSGFALYSAVYAFIFGGFAAVMLIAVRRNARERFTHLLAYLRSCFLTGSLLEYCDFADESETGRFHFSIAVAAGTAAAFILH